MTSTALQLKISSRAYLVAAVLALLLVFAGNAYATDYCVGDAACETAGGTAKPTVAAALDAADNDVAADRVLIGPGTFGAPTTTGSTYWNPGAKVEVRGAGAGQTVLTAPPGSSRVLEVLGASSSVVSDLSIAIPDHMTASGTGLRYIGTAHDVAVSADPAQTASFDGVNIGADSVLEDASVDLPDAAGQRNAVAVS